MTVPHTNKKTQFHSMLSGWFQNFGPIASHVICERIYQHTEAHFVAWFFHGFDLSFQSFLPRSTVTWTAFKNHRSILSGCFGVHKNGKVFVYSKPLPENRSSNIKNKKRLLTITHLDTRMGFDIIC